MACGTFGLPCGAVGVLCGASAGGLGSGLAGCGIFEKCRSLVFVVGGRGGGSTLVGEYEEKQHRGTEGRRLGNVGKSDRDCAVWHVVRLGYRVVRLGYCVVRLQEVSGPDWLCAAFLECAVL